MDKKNENSPFDLIRWESLSSEVGGLKKDLCNTSEACEHIANSVNTNFANLVNLLDERFALISEQFERIHKVLSSMNEVDTGQQTNIDLIIKALRKISEEVQDLKLV